MKVVLFLFSSLLLFYTDPVEKFTYKERPQLTWNDFKGVPPKNATHFASVNSGMGYRFTSKNIDGKLTIDVDVKTYFYPQLSWKKNSNENNQGLLTHEQLHWDISELYARKLRAAYKKYIPQKNPKKEVDYAFDLEDETYLHIFMVAKKITKALDKVFDTTRTCLVVEGFEVPHVHIKLYPMTKTDTNLADAIDKPKEQTNELLQMQANQIKTAL